MINKLSCHRLIFVTLCCSVVVLFVSTITTYAASSHNTLLKHPKLIEDEYENDDYYNDTTSSNNTSTTATNMPKNNRFIPKAYIVRLKPASTTVNKTITTTSGTVIVSSIMEYLMKTTIQDGGKIRHVFKNVFNGFSVTGMSNERMIQILDDDVVEFATRVRIFDNGGSIAAFFLAVDHESSY
jgi:hypothetical protein